MAITTAITGTCQQAYMDGAYMGRVIGASFNDAAGGVHRRGTGGTDQLSTGFFVPGGNVRMYPTEASTFLQTVGGKIVRSATGYPCSDLPTFDLLFQSEVNMTFNDCKTRGISLDCSVGEALTAALDFQSLSITEGDSAPVSPGSLGSLWEWYHASCKFGAGSGTLTGEYSLEGFSLSLENSLTPRSDMDGFAPGQSVRTPKRLFVGDEAVRFTLRTKNPIPSSVRKNLEDNMATDLAFDAVFTNGTSVLTINIDNAMNMSGENVLEQEDGVAIYTYAFEARYCSQALSITMA